ncbi:MAG: PKD domain-containing protein, partial [Myxococcota bacterium]
PDDHALTYDWRFVSKPGGSSATLVDDDREDPQFVPDVPGRYEVGLVVNDGALDSDEDTVEITVTEENGAPVANAGRDQSVAVGATVTLDGSASSDPEGDGLQFAWTLVTRPSGSSATLSSTTSAAPRFTADVAGVYEVSLTVADGTETSAPDSARITASAPDDGGGDSGCGCRAGDTRSAFGTALLVALAGLAHRRPRR